ncbi:hypothetical protein CTU88_28075 [Streptomyces sp. JV178]|uniref:hypothetical protein n=1 Tax=unclassified Streptomyces TaxID=2593676 RepID=UPI000C1B1B6B|nr:hypothetical protein [Streptomyces sp. JV178]PIM69809.1 hypothetical protein CTU88_28075 [Streptomyces sp. JV178]
MYGKGMGGAVRRGAMVMGTAVLASALAVPAATADGPTEKYLGKRQGKIKIIVYPYTWVDKQYRSTSLKNLRKHSIRITYKKCAWWKARASVKWGKTVDTVETTVKGCNKSVVLSPMGNLKANVTLTIHQLNADDSSGSTSIKPIG